MKIQQMKEIEGIPYITGVRTHYVYTGKYARNTIVKHYISNIFFIRENLIKHIVVMSSLVKYTLHHKI